MTSVTHVLPHTPRRLTTTAPTVVARRIPWGDNETSGQSDPGRARGDVHDAGGDRSCGRGPHGHEGQAGAAPARLPAVGHADVAVRHVGPDGDEPPEPGLHRSAHQRAVLRRAGGLRRQRDPVRLGHEAPRPERWRARPLRVDPPPRLRAVLDDLRALLEERPDRGHRRSLHGRPDRALRAGPGAAEAPRLPAVPATSRTSSRSARRTTARATPAGAGRRSAARCRAAARS